jgi:hypothetical protein
MKKMMFKLKFMIVRFLFVTLGISMLLVVVSCKKDTDSTEISAIGVIQKQGITTYQYGTHILINSNQQTFFALTSENVNLDDFLNKTVEIKGHKVNGYPVEDGPEYLKVTEIRE